MLCKAVLCSFRMEIESVKCQKESLYEPDNVGPLLEAKEKQQWSYHHTASMISTPVEYTHIVDSDLCSTIFDLFKCWIYYSFTS